MTASESALHYLRYSEMNFNAKMIALRNHTARTLGPGLASVMVAAALGCHDPAEEFGKIYYLDGAGNWGFGVSEVPEGLRTAGYQGSVEVFIWTSSLNPAVDQVNIVNNKVRAAILSGKIQDYIRRYPEQDVNLIGLSAGTGIATWAVEGLSGDYKINNLVLLGSSLSYDYDMSSALSHIKGRVFVYYSPHDEVLTTGAAALGTVDRKFVDGAGLRGLHPNGRDDPRIVNIGWTSRYSRFGWTGAHTDATSPAFIAREVAPRILPRPQRSTAAAESWNARPSRYALIARSFERRADARFPCPYD